jgi:hypothetical protein
LSRGRWPIVMNVIMTSFTERYALALS